MIFYLWKDLENINSEPNIESQQLIKPLPLNQSLSKTSSCLKNLHDFLFSNISSNQELFYLQPKEQIKTYLQESYFLPIVKSLNTEKNTNNIYLSSDKTLYYFNGGTRVKIQPQLYYNQLLLNSNLTLQAHILNYQESSYILDLKNFLQLRKIKTPISFLLFGGGGSGNQYGGGGGGDCKFIVIDGDTADSLNSTTITIGGSDQPTICSFKYNDNTEESIVVEAGQKGMLNPDNDQQGIGGSGGSGGGGNGARYSWNQGVIDDYNESACNSSKGGNASYGGGGGGGGALIKINRDVYDNFQVISSNSDNKGGQGGQLFLSKDMINIEEIIANGGDGGSGGGVDAFGNNYNFSLKIDNNNSTGGGSGEEGQSGTILKNNFNLLVNFPIDSSNCTGGSASSKQEALESNASSAQFGNGIINYTIYSGGGGGGGTNSSGGPGKLGDKYNWSLYEKSIGLLYFPNGGGGGGGGFYGNGGEAYEGKTTISNFNNADYAIYQRCGGGGGGGGFGARGGNACQICGGGGGGYGINGTGGELQETWSSFIIKPAGIAAGGAGARPEDSERPGGAGICIIYYYSEIN